MPLILENVAVVGGEFALLFGDGVEVYLSLPLVRRACPCAVCQGEPDALGRVVRPKVEYGARSFELARFELVGGYALQMFWADGHNSGIFSFAYLRKLGELPPV
jgi:DUF971 family protein